jgi:hypothetical protein
VRSRRESGLLDAAGFEIFVRDELPMKPASAVCVRARRPA